MKHFTEIEITEFVLSGRTTSEFEEHLRECAGCRELYDDVAEFHRQLRQQPLALPGETAGHSINVRPEFVGDAPRLPGARSLTRRIYGIARRHPLAAGGGFVSGALLIASLFFYLNDRTSADLSYYRINLQQETIEVYNTEDDLLWSLPVGDAEHWERSEQERGKHLAMVSDFNDDGRNDLIVIGRTGADIQSDLLFKVYDRKKRLFRVFNTLADVDVSYKGVRYSHAFYPIFLRKAEIDGKMHLFALSNNSRSPSFIAHFDAHGNIIGRYWHFGQLTTMEFIDVDRDGTKELIAIGMNDVAFPGITDGVSVVLDPEKIIGERESSASRGFGLAVTAAEKYYVKYPRSDLDDSLQLQSVPRFIMNASPGFSLAVSSVQNEAPVLSFEYVIGGGMQVLDVKGDDGSARNHESYAKSGRLTSKYGQAYFDMMRRKVEYWDGVRWRTDAAPVQTQEIAEK